MTNAEVRVVELAKELIRLESESQRSNIAVSDYLQARLSDLDFDVERIEYTDHLGVQKACLVAKAGTGPGGLGIFAHSDTVPGMAGEWEPYNPIVTENRLIGRGACDMKGPIAAALVAVEQLSLAKLKAPLYFVVSADEEMHYTGAFHIVARSEILAAEWPEYGLVIEPTMLRPVYSHKGGVRIRVVAEGFAAHTSTGQGISANFRIAPFLAEMAELAEVFLTDERFRNEAFDPPTNAFNMVLDDGGCAPNVTAARTVCTLSLRPMPDDHHEEAVQMIRDAATRHGLESAAVVFPVVYTDPSSEIVRAATEITGVEQPETAPYGTEAAIYGKHSQLVILGPGNIEQAHTVGEWIELDQLHGAVDIYTSLIRRFCQ